MKNLCDFTSRFRILKGGKISLMVSAFCGSIRLSFAGVSSSAAVVTMLFFHSNAMADIVIDELSQTITAPSDFTLTTDVNDTNGGFAISVNTTNGVNGSITISNGITLTSNSSTAIALRDNASMGDITIDAGGAIQTTHNAVNSVATATMGTLYNNGTITGTSTGSALYLYNATKSQDSFLRIYLPTAA